MYQSISDVSKFLGLVVINIPFHGAHGSNVLAPGPDHGAGPGMPIVWTDGCPSLLKSECRPQHCLV